MIQTLQHKGTYVTKAVYYLCYVDILVHDSDSKLLFKFTSKEKNAIIKARWLTLYCCYLEQFELALLYSR